MTSRLASMKAGDERQHDLGAFLRKQRENTSRTALGLPPIRNRTTGLRREEVAAMSGISVTWYTWLEQGRDVTPSRQVLDAVARSLGLAQAQHAFVLSLAGYPATDFGSAQPITMPPSVQRLLDAQGVYPSYALSADWTIVGWNSTYGRFYPPAPATPVERRNLLWLTFTDPYIRSLVVDWEFTSSRVIAEFRAELGAHLHTPAIEILIDRLWRTSAEFRERWKAHEVTRFTSRLRTFRHPEVGDLQLEQHRMTMSGDPDLHVIIYVPDPDSGSLDRLHQLADLAASNEPRMNEDSER